MYGGQKNEICREKYPDKVSWKAYIRKRQRLEKKVSIETDQ